MQNIINKRHQESLKLLTSNVCMKDDDSWKVKSSSADIAYLVGKETSITFLLNADYALYAFITIPALVMIVFSVELYVNISLIYTLPR